MAGEINLDLILINKEKLVCYWDVLNPGDSLICLSFLCSIVNASAKNTRAKKRRLWTWTLEEWNSVSLKNFDQLRLMLRVKELEAR